MLDLETTGCNLQRDRIVEISVLRIEPDGRWDHRTRRVNPEIPIPPEATAIHGIKDSDVAAEPPFSKLAGGLLVLLEGCDLCGFNLKRFDLPLLCAELERAGKILDLTGRFIIDPMQIYHMYERRDLSTAVQFYLGREHIGAHGAAADALATAQILDAMLARYNDLPHNTAHLHKRFDDMVDRSRKFVRVSDQICFAFGKYRGQPLDAIVQTDREYLTYLLGLDFLPDTKAVITQALRHAHPS